MAETVIVGCKAPNGLVLNLDRYVRMSTDPNNLQVERVNGPATVLLKGWAQPADPKVRERWLKQPNASEHLIGGYALTEVPKEFWDAWYERNKTSSLLKDRTILPPHRDASGQAKGHADVEAMHRPIPSNGKDSRAPGVEIDKAA